MNTIFAPSLVVFSTKDNHLRRSFSSSVIVKEKNIRNQNFEALIVSYTHIEKALANQTPNVLFSLKTTKEQTAFSYPSPLSQVLGVKIGGQNKRLAYRGNERTKAKNARLYRVNRAFLRRVRRFRIESRRSTQTKIKNFSRTKALTGRTSIQDTTVSSKQVVANNFSSAIVIAGTNKTRTVYQSQTQAVGLHSATRVLALVINAPVNVYRVNGLTLARLGLDREKVALQTNNDSSSQFKNKTRNTNSGRVLAHLRETTGNRLGTSPAAVPDLVRLPFTALYIKAAPALAERLAHGLRTLPRQRKETAFLRSLIKLVKVLTALRPERLGLRIRLQGRVNRWRRTKHIVGERGHLPLYTYNARRESGAAQAITRKGAVGLRV